jgi:3-oxoacyl-[acyl-carrier-protein] synthase-1
MTMLSPSLAITGFGMTSSLGDAATACAAARAGLSGASPLLFEVEDPASFEMVPVSGHPARDLTRGFAEVGLMVRLMTLALADLLERTELSAEELEKTAVLVNLPSGFYFECADEARVQAAASGSGSTMPPEAEKSGSLAETFDATKPLYANAVIAKSFRALGMKIPPDDRQQVVFGDQSGIGHLIAAAHRLLASNVVSTCLVGGVDSLIEPRWLNCCAELGILKTPMQPVGLMPGEGAAFLLLEKAAPAGYGRPHFALIDACELGREPTHRFSDPMPVGRVLADLIDKCALSEASDASIISDLNGDPARSTEFGTALAQLQQRFHPPATLVPAISFGDTRAASGFLGVCVALRAFARGYAPSRNFVVACSGDDGGRAAMLVRAPS